jgi:hypothetical protein
MRALSLSTFAGVLCFAFGCSDDSSPTPGGSGAVAGGGSGNAGSGGAVSTGGNAGAAAGSGGAGASGGASAGSGGTAGGGSAGDTAGGSGSGVACAGLNNGSGTTIPCATTAEHKAVCFSTATPVTLKYTDGQDVTDVAQVTAKGFTEEACVLLTSGAVHCGRHDMISTTPQIPSGATMVSGGLNHACAIVGSSINCWGTEPPAQLSFDGETPVQVACYYHGCCAVTAEGGVYCWGENNGGMHGTTDNAARHDTPVSPATVPGKALYVGPGQDHMCAVFEGGRVQCWGQDWNKQLGGLGNSSDPGVTLVASGASAVVGGQFHTCVLMSSGAVQCTSQGQSEGGGLDQGMLATVSGVSTATALAAGKHYSCARLADGTVQCWGTVAGGSATPVTISGVTTAACE